MTGGVPDRYLRSAAAPAPRTLIDVLRATAAAHPQAAALDDGAAALTYAELLAEVDATAAWLAGLGIGRGDRLGVRLPSGSRGLYIAILATMACGAAYVPVDADDPDARAELVFAEAGVAGWFGPGGLHLDPARRPRAAAAGAAAPRGPEPGDDCWIIFTSGSTGRPKGVAVTHRSAAAFVDAEAGLFLADHPEGPLGVDDRVLAGLSVAFDASCEEMWLAWRHGACLVPAPRALVRSGVDLGPWLISRGITVVSTVPTLAGLWPAEALDGVRLLIVGGEACPPELVDRLAGGGRELWNTYGPTEATVVASAARLHPGGGTPIGLPLAGWDLAVVDGAGAPVAPGEVGELLIGGVGLARYLDPAKDAAAYAPAPELGWARAYRTGDQVRVGDRGLEFVGRIDDQVKIGGRRIELGEVAAQLSALPGVTQATVLVRRTGAGEPVLVGYLGAGGDAAAVDPGDCRRLLRARLPAALVPRLHVMAELPTRASGKVDAEALPWPLPAAAGEPAAADLDPVAAWLSGIWAEVLSVPPPGADADFFALGGTSLAAATVIARIRRAAPEAAVKDLYDHPRLGRLAEELAARGLVDPAADPAAAPAAPVRPVAPVPRRTRRIQAAVMVPLQLIRALKWLAWLAVLDWAAGAAGAPLAVGVPGWLAALLAAAFLTPLGTMPATAAVTRALTRGIRPGEHPRGGSVHLRLWAAERLADASGARDVAGAPWMTLYARALGARVGRGVSLHALPPVTGLLTLGERCSVEPETDLSGYWVDGDVVRVGPIEIGAEARVGARCTLLPGARVGAGAHVEAGSCVDGARRVRAGARWAGSPARPVGRPKHRFPDAPAPRRRYWAPIYAGTALLLALVPVAALAAAAAILGRAALARPEPAAALAAALAWTPVAAIAAFAGYAALTAALVRLLSAGLRPGVHPVRSATGWRAWAVERLMDAARTDLFPLYASSGTRAWFRLLGARVGRGAEISTTVGLPRFMDIRREAFLADDTMVAGYELGGGWLLLGRTRVGRRAFLGNSAVAGPGRKLGRDCLVAVLSAVPRKAKAGTNWWGSPPERMRRVAAAPAGGGRARTYAPPPRLRAARAAIELLRLAAPAASLALATLTLAGLHAVLRAVAGAAGGGPGAVAAGLAAAWLVAPVALLAAGGAAVAVTVAVKRACVGVHRPGEHPLYSRYVWLDELQDTFVEVLAAPWYLNPATGTGGLNRALRALGADIGRGAWLESYWLPEADLCRIGEAATVGRGCVVQTHLFQDRVMSLDRVELAAGASLGPHSVALPASRVGAGASIGPASLVMRGDRVPDGSRWRGNPVEPERYTG